MEPIGFTVGVVGLAGLFSVCLDVIDKVDSYKKFGLESRSIVAQFKADRHLLIQWAQEVGIDKSRLKSNHHTRLDNQETNLIVQEILSSIQEIFNNTDGTMSSLQNIVETGPTSFPDGIQFLNTRQKSQKPAGTISKRSRIGWSLRSKANFISQVQQFGALVQRLHSLVPPDRLTGPENMQRGIGGNDLTSMNNQDSWFSNSQELLIEMEKQIERETRKELDIWLGASWTNDVYDNVIRRKLDGTCDWILSRQAFLHWMSPDFPSGMAKILWINGPAGHGKTILCARIVQYLSSILESPFAYHFCSSESESRRDPLVIIRSWISQVILYNRDAFELAHGRWETKDGHSASQTDIVELFKSIVQHIPNCTFVVDGLDECAWAEEKWKSNNDDSPIGFFESVSRAAAHTTTRILILSRDEPEIRYGLRAALAGESHQSLKEYQLRPDDIRSDAVLFSRSIVDKKLTNKSEIIKDELSQRIVDRCQGMFLWVKMLEEQLRSGKNKKQLEETIDQTPTALDHLYDRNWVKISHLPEKDRLRAMSILRWTAFALRPLTVLEITEALVVDDDCEELLVDELPDAIDEDYVSNEILGLCGSLLETQKAESNQDLDSMTLHLAHFSVKQYILCNMPAQRGLLMVNERLRASGETFQSNELAKLCLRYLNFQSVWREPLQLQSGSVKRPFRDYAAGSWYRHTGECGSNYEEVIQLSNALFSSNNGNWRLWKNWFDTNDDKSKMPQTQREITSTNPLFYTSLLGLRDTIIYLLEEEKLDVNHVDEFNRTALQAAALKGQTLIVKLLLEKGADVNIANREEWTPLQSASDSGHIEVIKLLLEKGADMTATTQYGWTPLNLASSSGHIEAVKLLLEKEADLNVVNREGWAPLHSASDAGHVEVIKLLLEKGADIMITTKYGWTPLNSASDSGHIEVINLLLENGADLTVATQFGWTPLYSASNSGHIEVVKLLLEKGADMTVATQDGRTPLNSACQSGHSEVVKLLLEKGADWTVATQDGWMPLNSASSCGHIEIVKLLLEKGADLTVTNQYGWTPLNSASKSGHIEVVKLLLEKGADLMAATQYGWTPLHSASDSGHIEVVKLLLEKGADMTVANQDGWTPLNSASNKGHFEVIKLLLEKGADLTVATQSGWTPLKLASYYGHTKVVKLLLEKGADVIASISQDGWTPLYLASSNGHVEVVKLLLEKGADMMGTTQDGWTPLLLASNNGHSEVVMLLLEKGADLTIANQNGWTPLNSAIDNGHIEVVKLLLEKGADVTTTTRNGRTPLSLAAGNGYEAIVKLLLEFNAELESKDAMGRTPFWWASRHENGSVKILFDTDGVDIDSKDCYNSTPLSIAARMGHKDAVVLLLTRSRELDVKDNFGRTPLWWAKSTGHPDIADLLLEKYKENSMVVQEEDMPIANIVVSADENSRRCDVCVVNISDTDSYYHCKVCYNGDFDMCNDCFVLKACCLDASHTLIRETCKEQLSNT